MDGKRLDGPLQNVMLVHRHCELCAEAVKRICDGEVKPDEVVIFTPEFNARGNMVSRHVQIYKADDYGNLRDDEGHITRRVVDGDGVKRYHQHIHEEGAK